MQFTRKIEVNRKYDFSTEYPKSSVHMDNIKGNKDNVQSCPEDYVYFNKLFDKKSINWLIRLLTTIFLTGRPTSTRHGLNGIKPTPNGCFPANTFTLAQMWWGAILIFSYLYCRFFSTMPATAKSTAARFHHPAEAHYLTDFYIHLNTNSNKVNFCQCLSSSHQSLSLNF